MESLQTLAGYDDCSSLKWRLPKNYWYFCETRASPPPDTAASARSASPVIPFLRSYRRPRRHSPFSLFSLREKSSPLSAPRLRCLGEPDHREPRLMPPNQSRSSLLFFTFLLLEFRTGFVHSLFN
ncbi:hypothetical protein VIGAN_07236700 [Vigna angularis var. angularis]|uniref:Uncharacterized protein n=1 Tax=Vigna angularis var. angularis TaxID=157739 RepID=A0A0S3SKP9_PHAAN|nr:hypothetical protein VIGAN_07236700 [Vigna angularis var. angularis]